MLNLLFSFFFLKKKEDVLNQHWSSIQENNEHFSIKWMFQYESLNGIKWNSMKIKCFNPLRQATQHYLSDMGKLFASILSHWRWHQNVNVPMKCLLWWYCSIPVEKPNFATFFFALIFTRKIWSLLEKKKGSTTLFMSKQTGYDSESPLFLQLLSEQWELVDGEVFWKRCPF